MSVDGRFANPEGKAGQGNVRSSYVNLHRYDRKDLQHWMEKQVYLAIGTLNREYYRQYGIPAEKIFSVPYAVDNAFFQAGAEGAAARREELRQELGLEMGRPVILYVSKLEPRKRPADLLGAVLWLMSPASAFVTGIVVPVDGGFSAFSGV